MDWVYHGFADDPLLERDSLGLIRISRRVGRRAVVQHLQQRPEILENVQVDFRTPSGHQLRGSTAWIPKSSLLPDGEGDVVLTSGTLEARAGPPHATVTWCGSFGAGAESSPCDPIACWCLKNATGDELLDHHRHGRKRSFVRFLGNLQCCAEFALPDSPDAFVLAGEAWLPLKQEAVVFVGHRLNDNDESLQGTIYSCGKAADEGRFGIELQGAEDGDEHGHQRLVLHRHPEAPHGVGPTAPAFYCKLQTPTRIGRQVSCANFLDFLTVALDLVGPPCEDQFVLWQELQRAVRSTRMTREGRKAVTAAIEERTGVAIRNRYFCLQLRSFCWDQAWKSAASFTLRAQCVREALQECSTTKNDALQRCSFFHDNELFPHSSAQKLCDVTFAESLDAVFSNSCATSTKFEALTCLIDLFNAMAAIAAATNLDFSVAHPTSARMRGDGDDERIDSLGLLEVIQSSVNEIASKADVDADAMNTITWKITSALRISDADQVLAVLRRLPRDWSQNPCSRESFLIWKQLSACDTGCRVLLQRVASEGAGVISAVAFVLYWSAYNALTSRKDGLDVNNFAVRPPMKKDMEPSAVLSHFFSSVAPKMLLGGDSAEWVSKLHRSLPCCRSGPLGSPTPLDDRWFFVPKAAALTMALRFTEVHKDHKEAADLLYALGHHLSCDKQSTVLEGKSVTSVEVMDRVIREHRSCSKADAPEKMLRQAHFAMFWKLIDLRERGLPFQNTLDELFSIQAVTTGGEQWPTNHLSFLLTLFLPRDTRVKDFCAHWSDRSRWEKIGGGSFGSVFKVRSALLNAMFDSEVVVKEFASTDGSNPEYCTFATPHLRRDGEDRLQQGEPQPADVTVWQALDVIKLETLEQRFVLPLGTQVSNNVRLLLMKSQKEGTLTTFLRSSQRSNLNVLRRLLRDVLLSLVTLHQVLELVHHDLKPDNILLSKSKAGVLRARIADFGLCLRRGHSSCGGTPMYLPPEPHSSDGSKDMWAFGCIVVQAGCHNVAENGWTPAKISDNVHIAQAAQTLAPADLGFHDALRECFSRNPDKRISAHKMLRASFFRHQSVFHPIGVEEKSDDDEFDDLMSSSSSSSLSS